MKFRFVFQVILVLAYFFSSESAFALDKIKWKPVEKGLFFVILHDEAGKYFVNSYYLSEETLQIKLDSQQFDDQEAALEYFKVKTRNYVDDKPAHLFSDREAWTENRSRRIWPSQNQWDAEWESKYSDWIRLEVGPDFFQKYQIAVDCANVPIALRWIFSRIHGLPAGNQLAGSGILFSNRSFRNAWGELGTHDNWFEDSLFLAALNYVLDHTYTHSLMGDLYPVEINKNYITPGAVFLNLFNQRTGHAELITNFVFENTHPTPLRVISSTVPRAIRILPEQGFRN